MTARVIILAQGQQSRLPDLDRPKQLLELKACRMPILIRTLHMIGRTLGGAEVTVVCGEPIASQVMRMIEWKNRHPEGIVDPRYMEPPYVKYPLTCVSLPAPGNSSLKGLERFMASRWGDKHESTHVLLGDVVYSWQCLRAIFNVKLAPEPMGVKWSNTSEFPIAFVGTRDLTPSSGELWGVSWNRAAGGYMEELMTKAMHRHPPAQVDDVYQPGQLRRLLFAQDDREAYLRTKYDLRQDRWWFIPVDDYTMDVDVPEHIPFLDTVSELARADDMEHIRG